MHRIAALVAVSLAVTCMAAPSLADPPKILVDGVIARTDVPAIVAGGHVLVPLRGVLERFGASVDYDARNNAAIAMRRGTVVRVAIGTSDAWIDGRHVTLDAAAREFGGRVEVPLRFIAEALGVSVDYDDLTNTVVILSGIKPGNFVAAGPGTPSINSYAAAAVPVSAPAVAEERPSPDALIGSEYPQIYARFAGGGSSVDPGTVRLIVDGADVTDAATVSSAYVAYTPSTPLGGGTHTVQITGQAADGAPLSAEWSFRVDAGMTSAYVSSFIGSSASPFGVPRFGFFPPGFSVFAPGPQFFVEDEPIVIIFFSPFFPNGSGFFTISGFPGQFSMTPWLGCPGFFWSALTVPAGIDDPDAVVAAHFSMSDGRKVIVHSTAPLRIDGMRKSLPSDIRFAVRARLVNRPATPRALVAFRRFSPPTRLPVIGRTPTPIARGVSRGLASAGRMPMPIGRQLMPVGVVRTQPVMRSLPVVRAPAPIVPPTRPLIPITPAPQPRPLPVKPVPPPQ